MAWQPVGPGTGADSANTYYQEVGGSGRWFSSSTPIPADSLTSDAVPPGGGTAHTDAPPESAPAALRDSYRLAHPPPEPDGGGRRRPVVSGTPLHNAPTSEFPPDMQPAADRLTAAGIDPDAYFTAAGISSSGTAASRATALRGITDVPAGEGGNADLRDTFRIKAAEYELNALRSKNVSPSDSYAYLRAQGLLGTGATPPERWPPTGTPIRLGTPPGDRATALGMLPNDGAGHRTTPVSDVTASIVDFGDRPSPAPDSVLGRLSAGGTTATSRAEIMRTETRRLEITNQWMEYATRPTSGTPPGLGYSADRARGVLQNMSPPLLDSSGRVTGFDVNTAAHSLFNVPEGTTIANNAVFNAPPSEGAAPPYSPRGPSLSGATPLNMDQPVPAHTGVPDPLTQGAISYMGTPAGAPAVAPSGGPGGGPAPVGAGGDANAVAPVGPRLSGTELEYLQDQVRWFRDNGRPIPSGLAGRARANGMDLSGMTLSTPTGGGTAGASGVGTGGGTTGGVGTGGGPGGSGGVGGAGGASGPFAPVPTATATPTRPAEGPLAAEWDRMHAMNFTDAEIAEYQRQHPGREAAAINGSFLRPDGTPIPAGERAGVVTSTRTALREGMITETANGIFEAGRSQNIQPPITRENARLMAEQMYRERARTGDVDPSLDQMLANRTSVAEDVHWLAEPSQAGRINGTSPPGLLMRTAVHEENAFYVEARRVDPNGMWNGTNGRTHLRGFLSRDGGRGAAILNDPSALREARTHASPPLAERLEAYRRMPGPERTAIEGAVTAANPTDTPDFSGITPASARATAMANWQQTQIQHNWQEATTVRAREWQVADHVRDRGEAVEDRDMLRADTYANNMRQQRSTERLQAQQLAFNVGTQFAQMGMQVTQEQQRHINQLTLQQLQAMFAVTQQLIAQGTPKPFDIVMGMLSGGRR